MRGDDGMRQSHGASDGCKKNAQKKEHSTIIRPLVGGFFMNPLDLFLFWVYSEDMKKVVLSLIVISSFLGIAVFGFMAMSPDANGHHSGCIAATAQGAGCPAEAETLGFVSFHLRAFKNFSSATFGEQFAAPFLLALILCIGFGIKANRHIQTVSSRFISQFQKHFVHLIVPLKLNLARWFALHENSPATL